MVLPHSTVFATNCKEKADFLVGASGNEAEYNIHATKTLKKGDTNMKSLVEFVSNWYLYGSMTSTVDIWGDAEKQLSARVFVYDILNKKEVYSSESFFDNHKHQ